MTSSVVVLAILAVIALAAQLIHHAVMAGMGVYGRGFPDRDLDVEVAERLRHDLGRLAQAKGLTERRAAALREAEDSARTDEPPDREALVEEFAESSRLVSETMGELVAGARSNHGTRSRPFKGAAMAVPVLLMVVLLTVLVLQTAATA